ncbi:MAG: DNA-processing protein DprA [Alphaproteobacteria bacterium]|nr:DNA-processing protein DprA [Alphaproteobacteria bacterium]MCB9928012.1 DNA-protecting protein DprA [Alphaproteobacteria bacterium]
MTDPDERRARLQLARSHGIGPRRFQSLIERFGSAVEALKRTAYIRKRLGDAWAPASLDRVLVEAKALKAMDGRFLLLGDPDYPPLLAHSAAPPPVLSILGGAEALHRRAVAIVGARNASAAGVRLAEELAAGLGRHGIVIVSGLARGIDAGAHRGALASGTVAVTAGGLDKLYPAEHAQLAAAIRETGAVVSEMPLGTETRAELFPRRNRIVAGLSVGVVVVEAAPRSGSLITARYALEEGRELCAVPGSPLDPRAAGPNQLLRAGATFVETAEDVLAALPAMAAAAERPPLYGYADRLPNHLRESDDGPLDREDDHTQRLLEALGATPVTVDELCRRCHLSSIEVARLLAELELDGRLERHPGQYVSLR